MFEQFIYLITFQEWDEDYENIEDFQLEASNEDEYSQIGKDSVVKDQQV